MNVKTILGLDLGTNSIGWALVKENSVHHFSNEIIKLGVRVNPLTTDEKTDFEKGKPLSTNAERTLKRSARRNLQRFKYRKKELIKILYKNHFITNETLLTEVGKNSTFETLSLRAKAAKEQIELNELARVFLTINKKRGYKSSRKVKTTEEEGIAIDGMQIAKYLYDNQLTPGQYVLTLLQKNKKFIPDFYRSDLKAEFDRIWNFQKQFYSEILDEDLYTTLEGKGKENTRKIILAKKGIYTADIKGSREEKQLKSYELRSDALQKQLAIEEVAFVLVEINNNLNKSSGYLGAISDRSKYLYFNKITVGEYLYAQIQKNPHTSLKNQVFYRQDYLDEFEQIWEIQAQFNSQLTPKLKEEIRDCIIFYQRKLKSQKSVLGFCQFESQEQEYIDQETGKIKKRTIGRKVIPKSSPLFQEFKIWLNINNIEFKRVDKQKRDLFNPEIQEKFILNEEQRRLLFQELNLRGKLKAKEVFNLLRISDKEFKCNYTEIEGNTTNKSLFEVYKTIAENEGYAFDWEKKKAVEIIDELKVVFKDLGINPEILTFDALNKELDQQISYSFWHLLYSAEDDGKVKEEDRIIYGDSNVNLKKQLHQKFGFKPEYAGLLVHVALQDDYGSLSAKAIRKILPFLVEGNKYDEACDYAGYNHSKSETTEDLENKILKEKLELLPKNSLRNPVVEKILNQMINLVNQVVETYGKPDEIRIELARELKKSASERSDAIKEINAATQKNEEVKKIILQEFGFNPSKNDVIRYKLWQELEKVGYKSIFDNQYIPKEKIFSKEIDIEHIIPKAILFDDSFSNKTLAYRKINLQKGERTAMDFIEQDFKSETESYINRVENWFKLGSISKGKYKKLLMKSENLPTDFIERDLRNSQYISKKARAILLESFKTVVSTSGQITDKLREDWGIIDVMKELNLPKYRELGLTEIEKRWNNGEEKIKEVEVLKDWTKRNDHRHHAMDALTVAFTTHNHIQYINNLNARKDEKSKKHSTIIAIETTSTEKIDNKRVFKKPMSNFRSEVKKHLENILISFKNKNKVVTKNINKTKKKGGVNKKIQLTPRGQLHKETIYGSAKIPMEKPVKLDKKFQLSLLDLIINKEVKEIVSAHLQKFDNKPAIAFDTKTIKKNPILFKNEPLKEVHCFEIVYTIRKDISSDLKIDKVIDKGIQEILKTRLNEFSNDSKKAFSDLEKNPIWLNKEKGITIKRVTITGVNNVEVLHTKKDHLGKEILDQNNKPIPSDFVSTGNNHHVAIYEDAEGNLQEQIVSFYEAVQRANHNSPIIDKEYNTHLGWKFLFTMKQNEMFVFPTKDFNPTEIDLLDEKNYKLISKHLFRVQKISTKNYMFVNHLETISIDGEMLKKYKNLSEITYNFIQSPNKLKGIVKVRINHIGKIVEIGEY